MIEAQKRLYFTVFAAKRMVKGAATLTSFAPEEGSRQNVMRQLDRFYFAANPKNLN